MSTLTADKHLTEDLFTNDFSLKTNLNKGLSFIHYIFSSAFDVRSSYDEEEKQSYSCFNHTLKIILYENDLVLVFLLEETPSYYHTKS